MGKRQFCLFCFLMPEGTCARMKDGLRRKEKYPSAGPGHATILFHLNFPYYQNLGHIRTACFQAARAETQTLVTCEILVQHLSAELWS